MALQEKKSKLLTEENATLCIWACHSCNRKPRWHEHGSCWGVARSWSATHRWPVMSPTKAAVRSAPEPRSKQFILYLRLYTTYLGGTTSSWQPLAVSKMATSAVSGHATVRLCEKNVKLGKIKNSKSVKAASHTCAHCVATTTFVYDRCDRNDYPLRIHTYAKNSVGCNQHTFLLLPER